MQWPFRRLDAGLIDVGDPTFRVRRRYPEALLASLRSSGIRTPLLVQSVGVSWRLVSGWGRWLYRGEERSLPCYELPPDLDPDALWEIFLRDNERWNVLEIARILERLGDLPGLDAERIVAAKLPLLGLHAASDVFRRHAQLLTLGPLARDFIEAEDLPLRRAAMLLKLRPAALEDFIAMARELRFTLNEVGEALEQLEEIAHRDRVPAAEVLAGLRAGDGWPAKDALRQALRARRYPELTRLGDRLAALEKELRFSVPVRIEWDARLERPGIRLAADLADPGALATFERDLEANRELLRRFFDVL